MQILSLQEIGDRESVFLKTLLYNPEMWFDLPCPQFVVSAWRKGSLMKFKL